MYARGLGVAEDYKEASRWFRLAAEQGTARAQNVLGVMYQSGLGVPANAVLAYALFSLSVANSGSTQTSATENRDSIANTMSPEEIDSAQALSLTLSNGSLNQAIDRYVQTEESELRVATYYSQ